MEAFEDYIKNGKNGKRRSLEGSMLAFCKVVADEKDLPINKDGEHLKLKAARDDAKNNPIVNKFKEEHVKNIITIKTHFKNLMTEIGLSGNINEQTFRELLNTYRTKHKVPNFLNLKNQQTNTIGKNRSVGNVRRKITVYENLNGNTTPSKKRMSFKDLKHKHTVNDTNKRGKILIGAKRTLKQKKETATTLIDSFLNAVKTNSTQIETITKNLGKVEATDANEALDIKNAIFEAVNICLKKNNPTLAQNICDWFGIQSTTLKKKIENHKETEKNTKKTEKPLIEKNRNLNKNDTLLERIKKFKQKIIEDQVAHKEDYHSMYTEKNELIKEIQKSNDPSVKNEYSNFNTEFKKWVYARQNGAARK